MLNISLKDKYNFNYDGLVISGGGNYCIKQLSTLVYLQNKNYINFSDIKYFAGTSSGSILVSLLAFGYSPLEIFQRLTKFPKISIAGLNFKNFIGHFSLLSLDPLLREIEIMLKEKLENCETFSDLRKIKKNKLFIVGSNIQKMIEENFSYISSPNMKIIDAIKISCSYPIIFPLVYYNNQVYSDGGIFNNIPIDLIYEYSKKNILVIHINFDNGKDDEQKKSTIKYINDIISYLCFKNDITKLEEYRNKNNVKFIELNQTKALDTGIFFLSMPIIKQKGNSFVKLFNLCYEELEKDLF